MKYTIVLLRVSTNKQETELQRHAMKEEIKRRELHEVPMESFCADRTNYTQREGIAVYIEDKLTGRTDARTGYQFALNEIRSGHIKSVLIYRIDRIGRSTLNNCIFAKACKEKQVELFSLHEEINLSSASGQMMFEMMSMAATYQSNVYSENVKAGIAAKKAKCAKQGIPFVHGGTVKGWSYQDKIKLLPLFYKQVALGMNNYQIRQVLGWNLRTIRKYRAMRIEDHVSRKELNTRVFGKSDAVI